MCLNSSRRLRRVVSQTFTTICMNRGNSDVVSGLVECHCQYKKGTGMVTTRLLTIDNFSHTALEPRHSSSNKEACRTDYWGFFCFLFCFCGFL